MDLQVVEKMQILSRLDHMTFLQQPGFGSSWRRFEEW
jgi:hypothetical protein